MLPRPRRAPPHIGVRRVDPQIGDQRLGETLYAGLKPADIDGIATAGETPVTVAHYLGLTPKWIGRRLLVHDPCPPRRRGD